jgi:hypothetical protein
MVRAPSGTRLAQQWRMSDQSWQFVAGRSPPMLRNHPGNVTAAKQFNRRDFDADAPVKATPARPIQ